MSLRLGDTFMPFLKPHDLEIVTRSFLSKPLLYLFTFFILMDLLFFFPCWLSNFSIAMFTCLEKTLMLGQTEGRRNGTTEDEMVGWCRQLIGHELEQTQRW